MKKFDFIRAGIYTSEIQVDEYIKTNEKKDVLTGSIGSIIHNILISNFCKKLVFVRKAYSQIKSSK